MLVKKSLSKKYFNKNTKRQRRREKAKNYACEKLPEYKVFHWNLKCTKQDSETILTVKTMEKKLYDTCVVFLKFAIQ